MSKDKILLTFLSAIVFLWLPLCVCGAVSQPRFSVESQLTEFVKQIYGDAETEVTFNLPQQLRGDALARNISFSKVPDLSGDGICLVSVESKGGVETNVYVPFKVLAKRPLYSLKSSMTKGDVLRYSDVTSKQTFLAGGRKGYPRSLEDVVGKSLKRDMAAGEIVTLQVLEDHVAVLKGEVVNMTLENARLLVQAKGTALEKGKMGEVIRIKSASGREIKGRVTGSNSVTVQF
jgi:flagella basal body P-ring formation protein FlgA